MNTKRLMSSIVAMILILCTLLTSCNSGKSVDTSKDDVTTASPSTTTTENITTTQKPDGTTSSPNLPDDPAANCKHETTVKKNVKAATCAVKGYTGDDVCSACGTVVTKGTETDLIDHVYDNGKITKEPTCIEQGVFTFTCTGCGTTKTDSLQKVPHKDEYHDALDGTHDHTCEFCTLSENAAHTPKDNGVLHPADCLSAEYTEHTCSLCNGVYRLYTEGSTALGCSFGDWSVTKNATCSADGEMTRTCTRCTGVETLAIPKNDASHSYKLVNTFPATCSDEGTERHQCEFCDDAYTVTLQKLPHNYTSVETLDNGWTHKHCDCGFKLSTFDAKNLVEAKVEAADIPEDNSFEVSLEKADIVFPDTVVSQFKDGEGELSIKADVMPEQHKNDLINSQNSNLTADQKERLSDVDVYDFGVTLGGNYVSSFESEVSVTLPYTLKEGENAEGIVVWYVKEDGTIENVTAIYNDTAKTVTFSVSHFSFYAIAYEETQEMRCKRGNHAYYATPTVVKADCTQHGYTLYECECCHYKHISDIVEKKNHALGDVIQPTVDCTTGGYTHRVCADCGYTVNIDYVRAKGHTPGAAATCETPCVCTVCNNVIIPAKTHKYTEWETVKAPTGSEEGIKRRYCTNCGRAEEKAVPPTGLAEKIEFTSYGDLYNYIFRDLLRIDGGTLSFQTKQTQGQQSMARNINISIANDGTNYSILIKETMSQTADNTTQSRSMYILVRNGMMFEIEPNENGTSYVYISSTDSATVEKDLAETFYNGFEEIDFSMMSMFELADAVITLGNLKPERINELFASADLAMDLAEFTQHVNTLKAEYVYIASLFGYDSKVVVPDGVKAGGISNILSVITSMMTGSGNGKYSYLLSSLLDAGKELLNTYDSYAELPLSDALYEIFKEEITAKFPDLTTRASVEAKLRESFPGTMKVSEAVDKIMSTVCGNDKAKLDSVYDTINSIAKFYVPSGEEFDIEAIILEYADYTLDRFAQEIMEAESIANVFDMIFAQGNETLFKEVLGYYSQSTRPEPNYPMGDNVTVQPSEPEQPTFHENPMIAEIREYLSMGKYSDGSKFEIFIKDNGLLDSANGNITVDVAKDKDSGDIVPVDKINPATPDQYVHLITEISFSFKEDKNTTLTLPSLVETVKDYSAKLSYDNDGNLVIETNSSLLDLTFKVNGHTYVNLADIMVKDNDLSAEKGFDVYYPNDKSYWDYSSTEPKNFIRYNGKVYSVFEKYTSSYNEVKAKIAITDLIASPLSYVNVTEEDQNGYVEINKERIPVYNSFAGLICQINGEWMLLNEQNLDYNYYHEEYYDKENDKYYDKSYKLWYNYNGELVYAKLTDVISSISLSNTDQLYYEDGYKDANGNAVNYTISLLNFSVDNDAWGGDYTLSLIGCIESDGRISILDYEYHSGTYFTCLGEVADVSEYADYAMYTYTRDYPLYDKDMNKLADSYEAVSFRKEIRVPQYYVKLGDSYVLLSQLRAIPNINFEAITLPDSTKLYVVLSEGDTNNGIIYGYMHVSGNLYTECACVFENGALAEKIFRYETGDSYRDFYDDDISSYITKQGNKYIVSANLFKKYTDLCDASSGYSYFNIYARGKKTENNVEYSISLNLFRYSVDADHQGNDYYIEWSRAFDNISFDYYNVKVNDDGTLSFWFGDGSKITMTLNSSNYWTVVQDDMIVKDDALSTQTGLDVGSTTAKDTYTSDYLYIDGKYYHYSSYSVFKSETVSSVEELFRTTYYVDELSYRYDFTDDRGNVYKIYQGYIRINRMDYFSSYGIKAFFAVKDGKLMVLVGAEERGESVLKFEGIVELDDYINSLTLEYHVDNKNWKYDTVYLNGSLRDVYSMSVSIYEKDASGNSVKYVGYFYAYYYKTGNANSFIKGAYYDPNANGSYIKKGELANLPENVIEIDREEMVEYNGIFTSATVYYNVFKTYTYIKVDGTYYYYNYDSSYDCYLNYRMNEEDALNRIGDLTWEYVIYMPVNGDWNYYFCSGISFNKDFVTVESIGSPFTRSYNDTKYIGTTKDGYDVYEISYMTWPKELDVETRPDGTVFYAKKGENYGILKCPDGSYFNAERITRNDGSTKIVLTSISPAEMTVSKETMLTYLNKYITYSSNNSVITFSPDIITELEQIFGRNIYDIDLSFTFTSENGDKYRLSIHEIAEYLAYNSNGNGDKYDKYGK